MSSYSVKAKQDCTVLQCHLLVVLSALRFVPAVKTHAPVLQASSPLTLRNVLPSPGEPIIQIDRDTPSSDSVTASCIYISKSGLHFQTVLILPCTDSMLKGTDDKQICNLFCIFIFKNPSRYKKRFIPKKCLWDEKNFNFHNIVVTAFQKFQMKN